MSYLNDIIKCYDLTIEDLTNEEIDQLLQLIAHSKKTYPFLIQCIESNRYPYTVMVIASKVGMYIPPIKRYGLATYKYFIRNLKYYENVLQRDQTKYMSPNIHEIYLSDNPIEYLQKFRDDEILIPGIIFSRNYKTRMEMLNRYINENFFSHGRFILLGTNKELYNITPLFSFDFKTQRKTIDLTEVKELVSSGKLHALALFSLYIEIYKFMNQYRRNDCSVIIWDDFKSIIGMIDKKIKDEWKIDESNYLGFLKI